MTPAIRNYDVYFAAWVGVAALVLATVFVAVLAPATLAVPLLAGLWLLPVLAAVVRSGDVFSPPGFLLLGYVLAWLGPALDLAQLDAGDRSLLLGHGPEYLVWPLAVSGVATGLLVVGYHSIRGDAVAARLRSLPAAWHHGRAVRAATVMLVVGGLAFVVLVATTIELPIRLSALSAKRRPPTEYLRRLALLLHVGTALLFVPVLDRDATDRGSHVLLFLLGLGLSVLFPIYTSQRGLLITFVISLLLVYHYLDRRVSILALVPLGLGGIVASNVMLVLRRASWKGLANVEVGTYLGIRGVVTFFEASPVGLATFSHLYHLVPGELGYRGGVTLLKWVVFPIPRAVWADKPRNLGQVLGEVVYEQGIGIVGAGTPPPLIGELYLNFGLVGVLVGSYLLGVVLRAGYAYLIEHRRNPMGPLLYAGFVALPLAAFRGPATLTMIGLLTWVLPLAVAFGYVNGWHRRRSAAGRGSVH